MIKKILFSFILTIAAISAFSQVVITGKVSCKNTKDGLEGATVFIDGTPTGTTTDNEGRYSIEVPKSDFKLSCSYLGYEQKTKKIKANSLPSRVNFELKESFNQLDEIMVAVDAKRAEIQRIKLSPMSVSVIDGGTLQGRASGVQEVLSRTAGIKIRQEGGLGSRTKVAVHGLEGNRVAIFINGFPLNSPDGSFDVNEIPIDVIERIEVYKGIVPAEYGGDGLGGAINIVTREADCDVIGFTYEQASYNTRRVFAAAKKRLEKPGVQIGMAYLHSSSHNDYKMDLTKINPEYHEDYHSNAKRRNDYFSSDMLVGNLVLDKLWFDEIEFEVAAYRNKKELQSVEFDSREAHTYGTNLINIFKFEKHNFFAKGLHIKSSFVMPIIRMHLIDTAKYYYDWDKNKGPMPSQGETVDGIFNQTSDKQIDVRHRFNVQYRINEKHRVNLNNQYAWSKYSPDDKFRLESSGYYLENYSNKSTTNITGLAHEYFSKDKKLQNSFIVKSYYLKTDVFDVSDRQKDISDSIRTDKPALSANDNIYFGFSEGLSYEFLPGIRAKLAFSLNNVRLPKSAELFGDGITTVAAPELKPEISNNFSLGLLLDRNEILGVHRFQFETNIYRSYVSEMMELKPAGSGVRYYKYNNIDKVKITGIDADLKVDFTEDLFGYYNITYQDVVNNLKYETDDKNIKNPKYDMTVPNKPMFYFNYGLEYHRYNWIGKNELTRFYVDGSFVDEFNAAWLFSKRKEEIERWSIPRVHTLSVGVQQSFLDNKLAINFQVDNITDATVYNNYKMPLPGRMFRAKIVYNWSRDKSEQGAMGF